MSVMHQIPAPLLPCTQDATLLDASSRIMYLAAEELGITRTILPDYQTILMTKNGKNWYTRGSRTSLQSAVGQTIVSNKAIAKKFLQAHQIPTAQAVKITSLVDLEKLQSLNWPLVMKPTEGAHGKDVIVGLSDFNEATKSWQKLNKPVLFEETLIGTEFRIVCVDYKFVAAAYRKPAFVTGDGLHTIAELIGLKNQQPDRAKGHRGNLSEISIDSELERVLATQKLNLTSIPNSGAEITLRKTANLSTGGEAENVTNKVCPENKELFERIAQIFDLDVLGIDIMCQSLATPIESQPKAGVIEINKSPGLRMHHFPSIGESIDVAKIILTTTISKLGA